MKKLFICFVLLLSFQSYSESMRDMIDQIFESQREMMDKMMDDDIFDSMGSFGSINSFGNINPSQAVSISSQIIKQNNKTYEVVTIKAEGEVSNFETDVDRMIKVSATVIQTKKDKNSSYSSSSSSTQIVPIPGSGKYIPSLTKKDKNSTTLYFEVDEAKVAENYGRQQLPKSLFKMKPRVSEPSPDYDEEDKTVVVPQRKI